MKRLSVILLSLFAGFFLASEAAAQERISFAKGTSAKEIKLTLPAGKSRSFYLYTAKAQVINVELSGDVGVEKPFPYMIVSANLKNGSDDDNWQDGDGFLSIYTGRKGKYIFEVSNGDRRSRTFTMNVSVTDNFADYNGGIKVKTTALEETLEKTREETRIEFAKGKTYKTMKITLPAETSRIFALYTASEQVINVDVSGDIYLKHSAGMGEMPLIRIGLLNGGNTDNWQDGAGFLSVFTGRKGKYLIDVYNAGSQTKTFTMNVSVTNDFEDYRGGIDSP